MEAAERIDNKRNKMDDNLYLVVVINNERFFFFSIANTVKVHFGLFRTSSGLFFGIMVPQ